MDPVTKRLEQLEQEIADVTAKEDRYWEACKSRRDPKRMSDLVHECELLCNQHMALITQRTALWAELTCPGVHLPVLSYTVLLEVNRETRGVSRTVCTRFAFCHLYNLISCIWPKLHWLLHAQPTKVPTPLKDTVCTNLASIVA